MRTRHDVLGDVLVDHGVGEPGERQPLTVDGDLRPPPRASAASDSAARTCSASVELVHARTPTRTLRNRAGRRRVAGVADLARLALAAVRRAPRHDLRRQHVHRAPELRADPGVRRVAQQPPELTVLHLVADLAAELEVEPLVVDRPRAVRLHVDAVVGGGDDLLERVRPGLEADVRHPHHRQPGPAVGAHAAGVVEPGDGGRVPPGQHADPRPVAHRVARRGRRALVVEAERAEGAGDRRIDRDVHQLRAVLQRTELGEVEPGRAGVGRLPAEDAVELDGVADGLVDLQRHLLAAEDQRRLAARARRRRQQGPRLLGDAGGVGLEVDLVDELPPPRAVLAAGRRVRAALRLAVADRRRHDPGAALAHALVDAVRPRSTRTTWPCPRSGTSPRRGRRRARPSSPSPASSRSPLSASDTPSGSIDGTRSPTTRRAPRRPAAAWPAGTPWRWRPRSPSPARRPGGPRRRRGRGRRRSPSPSRPGRAPRCRRPRSARRPRRSPLRAVIAS